MYTLQVVPLTKLPGALGQTLTYQFSEPLEPGTAVIVNVHTRNITGIVIICQLLTNDRVQELNNQAYTIKPIESVLSQTPLLTQKQITLAQWMAEFYAFPLGVILKLFIPKLTKVVKRYPKVLTIETPPAPDTQSQFLPRLFLGDAQTRLNHYKHRIQETDPTKQILILCPDKHSLARLSHDLAEYQPVSISGDLTTKQYRELWMQIKAGQTRLIISTRNGLFFPYYHLGLVIIEDATAESHASSEMKPKYAAQDIAAQLSTLHQAPCLFASLLPSIQTLHHLDTHGISVPEELIPQWQSDRVQIVSMMDQYRSGLEGPLSEPVIQSIKQAIQEKRPAVIFVNRRGESTYVACDDCGHHLRDPYSGSLLVEHRVDTLQSVPQGYRDTHVLVSHKSHKWFKMVHVCPKCGSDNLRRGGLGIEKLARMIQYSFPSISLEILSRDHSNTQEDQEAKIDDLIQGKTQVLFATSMIYKFLPRLQTTNFALIIPSAEALLGIPDYLSLEKAIHTLGACFMSAENTVIQSFQEWNPDEESIPPLLHRLAHGSVSQILHEEQSQRKTYSYPPYFQIISIHSAHGVRSKALHQAKNTKKALRAIGIRALGPLESYRPRGKGQSVFTLIIKATDAEATEIKKKVVPVLGHGQDVEINPPNLV